MEVRNDNDTNITMNNENILDDLNNNKLKNNLITPSHIIKIPKKRLLRFVIITDNDDFNDNDVRKKKEHRIKGDENFRTKKKSRSSIR